LGSTCRKEGGASFGSKIGGTWTKADGTVPVLNRRVDSNQHNETNKMGNRDEGSNLDLVAYMHLPVEETPPYNVCLGDCHRKVTRGCCKNITLQVEHHVVEETFYFFELGGVDLILRVT